VALVSVLYDRERSLSNARERLQVLGVDDVAKLVSSVADSYVPGVEGEPNDAEALRLLSAALAKGETAAAASPTAASVAARQAAPGQPAEGINWGLAIGIALAAIVVVGILLAVRYFARPSSGRLSTGREWPMHRESGARRRMETDEPEPQRPERRLNLSLFGGERGQPASEERESKRPTETAVIRKPGSSQPAGGVLGPRRSFTSRYRLGDDPFDEVHPILDPSTGLLIGACGLSASLQGRSSEGRGYYAFLVWVHDYQTPQSFKGIGLTTRWRIREKTEDIRAWVQSAMVDEVEAAETGLKTGLRTAHLDVEITLPEVEFLPDEEGLPDGYFRTLAVKFDVASVVPEQRPTGPGEGMATAGTRLAEEEQQ